jgi:hypothetical protein
MKRSSANERGGKMRGNERKHGKEEEPAPGLQKKEASGGRGGAGARRSRRESETRRDEQQQSKQGKRKREVKGNRWTEKAKERKSKKRTHTRRRTAPCTIKEGERERGEEREKMATSV